MTNKGRIRKICAIMALFVLNVVMVSNLKNAYSTDTYTWKLNSKITVTLGIMC